MSTVLNLPSPPPRGNTDTITLLLVAPISSGKRTLAKAILASETDADETRGASRPLVIRTRETLIQSSDTSSESIPSPADYLVLVIDSTRPDSLAEFERVLPALPIEWWSFLAVVVTKVDQRSRRTFNLLHVESILASYTSHIPIFFASPSSLRAIAARLHRLATNSSNGALEHCKRLHMETIRTFADRLPGDGDAMQV